jgi:hypothetical protein
VINLRAQAQDYFGFKQRSYTLTVPREEENEGLLLLGDPGTGKSQIMHQLIDEIANREQFEAIVIYDPVGEFLEQHYDPETDIILNPLDARCPYWSPVDEIENVTDETSAPERYFIAESFFPDHPHSAPTTQFFNKAARSIFAHLLAFKPSPERLVQMLTDEALIDACVAGTEHAHLIDRAAKAQRAGVLATLSEVGASLKLLPTLEQCDGRRFTFREWAQHRRHCIFITSTQSTREALRRTHAAWFNILFGKLMGTSVTTSGQRPCWVMIDEAHSLKRLPALETALVEGRKYRVKIVLGTQNKTQIEQSYERISATNAGCLTHEEFRPYQRVRLRALGVGHDRSAGDRAATCFYDRLGPVLWSRFAQLCARHRAQLRSQQGADHGLTKSAFLLEVW